MATLLIRIASALGVTALALFFVSLIPFFGDPTAGVGVTSRTSPLSVNRELKGDRLDGRVPVDFRPAAPQSGLDAKQSDKPGNVPIGCENSFSPISAPRLAHIYGRCMT